MATSHTIGRADAAIARALVNAGMSQHDIAAALGVNQGRIAEIASGQTYPDVPAADLSSRPIQDRISQAFDAAHSRLFHELERAIARAGGE